MNSGIISTAWLLSGDTGRELTCQITRGSTGQWIVALSLGSERMLSEEFLDEESAIHGAERLKAGLIAKGWTESLTP